MASPKAAAGTTYTLTAVSCPSTTACTAVGIRNASGTAVGATLIEQWNGTSWSITPSPTPTNTILAMNSISCTSATSCTAVGAIDDYAGYDPPRATPLIEQWDGKTWSLAAGATAPAPASGTSLRGVTCTNEIGCIAVGAGLGDGSYTLVERDI